MKRGTMLVLVLVRLLVLAEGAAVEGRGWATVGARGRLDRKSVV